ncbi:MAG: glycogen/starch synthase [Desulfobacterales bacterium]
MPTSLSNPTVLVVTPEVTYLPEGMGNMSNHLTAKAGGLADVSAALISALYDQGADVHVALPDYREIFAAHTAPVLKTEFRRIRDKMPDERIHLAEDRAFFYTTSVYSQYGSDNIKIALAFQREIINNILPRVKPDLIHCNDWMTGLVPAAAREMGIPCLFTVHNIHTVKTLLAAIEDRGIDAAYFWHHLYYENMAVEYETTREDIPVDFLVSGVFAAHFVNTVSPTFLDEIVAGQHDFVEAPLRQELINKAKAECATGILNAPDPSYHPETDTALAATYSATDHPKGKRANKRHLQRSLGLVQDDQAAVFFWPHRLDPVQKGCQLLAEILYQVVSKYWQRHLQIVFVANGEFKNVFHNIVAFHDLFDRVAVCGFDEQLARVAYGGSDFILMPSRFEPCGLPQMIGPLYGCLPVAHNTGGIHDTVAHLSVAADAGNGFLFDVYDSGGLFWAMDQAMLFHGHSAKIRQRQIRRIMQESAKTFTHDVTARHYINLYEKMLQRPLIAGPAH